MTYVRHGEERAVEVGRLQGEAVAVEGSAPQWPHDGDREAEERAGGGGLLLVEAEHLAERGVALARRVSRDTRSAQDSTARTSSVWVGSMRTFTRRSPFVSSRAAGATSHGTVQRIRTRRSNSVLRSLVVALLNTAGAE